MSSFVSRNRNTVVSALEIQLLRETVATMKLRNRQRAGSDYPMKYISLHEESPECNGARAAMEGRSQKRGESDVAGRRMCILLISDYEGLRTSREMLLRKQGYEVRSMSSGEFLESSEPCRCDLALLCQSLDSGRASAVGAVLRRRCPGSALLRIYPCRTSLEPAFDLGVDGFDGPEVLLGVLRQYVFTHPLRP